MPHRPFLQIGKGRQPLTRVRGHMAKFTQICYVGEFSRSV